MIRSGLLGRSILASRSPELHEKEAQALGLELRYELFDFSDRGWADEDLAAVLARMVAEGFSGFNVTYPFKQTVVPLLDALDESALAVGAVNTVAVTEGRLIGYNTDMAGFRGSFLDGLPGAGIDRVVQLGAGGAGAAVANALLSLGVRRLDLVDVDERRAARLRDDLAVRYPDAAVSVRHPGEVDTRDVDGIVNATPIGMNGKPGMPIAAALLQPSHWVADIIYFPPETELLRVAREKGCPAINGVGMVVGQAARAFEIITGHKADSLRMMQTLL
ncbi:shikimate dehydrogenase [Novosphingobium jiangmenense]|uniref:Shikimate dehydrogenase (NADP(+)) n=1 Tax=Novosphingobium jiangmenense TaxID=2791981 RepID=A0ABS0HJZ0_9SPHN|nr:shikimate dehydrogenase [Novosphingobium jiangmenense]MBF9152304.1 shikimate dehydrogenase [Novosphingobium jiangmenense]